MAAKDQKMFAERKTARDDEAGVERRVTFKRTRSYVLREMLEEAGRVKKETMSAIEEIEAALAPPEPVVKTEPVADEDEPRDVLGREECPVVSKKGKGYQQNSHNIAGVRERRRYHASVYRASFQPRGSRSIGGAERSLQKLKGKEKAGGRKSASKRAGMKEEAWTRLVDNPVKLRNNVLHIPRAVIRACIHGKIPRIKLFDRDNNVPCYCEMAKREDTIDRYIFGGWSDFCKDRNLQKGDALCFCIQHPPVEEISVAVRRGKA